MLSLWFSWPSLHWLSQKEIVAQSYSPHFSILLYPMWVLLEKDMKLSVPLIPLRQWKLSISGDPVSVYEKNPWASSTVTNLMHIHVLGNFHLSFFFCTVSENQCSKNTFLLKLVIQILRYFWLFMAHACNSIYVYIYIIYIYISDYVFSC